MKPLFVIDDDEDCKAILAQHNRLNALAPRSDCPRVFILWADEDNVFIAMHCYGYPEAKDNGYVLYILPKRYYTPEEIVAWYKRITECDEPGHEPVFCGYVEADPASN